MSPRTALSPIPPARIPLRRALVSNGADAIATQTYDAVLAIVVVSVLGFSTTQVGLLSTLGSLSFLLLSLPLGALVDRAGPAPALITGLAIKLVIAAATTTMLLCSWHSAVAVMALVTALGIATVATESAQTAIIPRLTADTGAISTTVARMATADSAAGIITPGAVGLLLALTPAPVPLAISAGCFVIALVGALRLLRAVRVLETAAPSTLGADHAPAASAATSSASGAGPLAGPAPAAHPSPPSGPDPASASPASPATAPAPDPGLWHGFRLITGDRVLLGSLLLSAAGNIGLAIGDTVESVLVLRVLGLGPAFYGLMGTLGAVAGLLASLAAPRVIAAVPLHRLFGVGGLCQGLVAALPLLALLVPAAAPVLLAAAAAAWAMVLTITNIAGSAYLARTVDPTMLGRTSAARRMIVMGSVPVATLAGGILADVAGMAVPLVLWPAITLAAAAAYAVLTRTGDGSRVPR